MRIVAGLLAAVGWFALALQFRLIFAVNIPAGVANAETVVRFFSYFTILTNVMAALVLTGTALGHRGTFFARPSVQTAVASYITIVGVVYGVILSGLWAPTGPQWLADRLLHYATPALYVLFWLFFVQKGTLQFRDSLWWLLFPLCYIVYVLARGSLSGFYPYPFIDVGKLGYSQVLINSAGMFVAFLVSGLVYVALGKLLARNLTRGTAT